MVGSHRGGNGGNIVIFDAHVLISPAGLGDEHSIERTRMRSAERAINPAFLVELRAAGFHGTRLQGGVFQDFSLRCTTAVFVYLTHSPVASQFENALLRPRAACRAGTRATPPKTGGSCDTG